VYVPSAGTASQPSIRIVTARSFHGLSAHGNAAFSKTRGGGSGVRNSVSPKTCARNPGRAPAGGDAAAGAIALPSFMSSFSGYVKTSTRFAPSTVTA